MSGQGEQAAVRVTIPGPPMPKRRPRVNTVTRRAYTPAETVAAEQAVAWAVKAALPADREWPSDASWRLVARFRCGRGSGRLIDGDNALKLLLDALIGVVWASDRQVIDVHYVVERGCADPCTELALFEVTA